MGLQESVKKEVQYERAEGELDPSGNDMAPIYNLEIFNIFLLRLFLSPLPNYCRNCQGSSRAVYMLCISKTACFPVNYAYVPSSLEGNSRAARL